LVEQGIIGLLAFIFVLLTPIMLFLNIIKYNLFNNQERALVASGMLIILHFGFYSFTASVFAHQSTTLFFVIFLAIIIGFLTSKDKKR
jgi:O-antigen ligase